MIKLKDLHVNGKLRLYKSCSNVVEESNDPGTHAEKISRTLAKGTWYVRVSSPGNGWSSKQYALRFKTD